MSKELSPEIEHDSFLSYIKGKVKALLLSDKTVILMIDEIHLTPYFDYKGGSIVGSAFNSNETATSAYASMLNSICSKFHDVVYNSSQDNKSRNSSYGFKESNHRLRENWFQCTLCCVRQQ